MVRIVLFGVLLYLGYRLVLHFLLSPRSGAATAASSGRDAGDDALVACEKCGTRVPRQSMVVRGGHLFCGTECAGS
ncbi:MAG: hypothetical protein HQL76_05585 [Magnetococcales bacterium]|nr:hypothetical protein [Magnetococcales bacterium]